MTLNEFFAAHPKCALGFSGGVDSAYLLYAGEAQGALGMGCEKLVQRHV